MQFTIGLDAELILEKNGRHAVASEYLPGTNAKFGCDGNQNVAEVRPRQAENPIELVRNIKTIFQKTLGQRPRIAGLKWKGGSSVHSYPIGAHIHFGHPKFLGSERVYNMQAVSVLLDTLVLPLATLFGDSNNETKRRECYGYAGDIRSQRWGFEYRSCSSFIASPTTALFIITAAFVVVNEFLEGRLTAVEASIQLDGGTFRRHPVEESKRNFDKRIEKLMSLQTVQENPMYKEILEVGTKLIGLGKYEQVDDMKDAWKLKYEVPEPQTFNLQRAIALAVRQF